VCVCVCGVCVCMCARAVSGMLARFEQNQKTIISNAWKRHVTYE